MKSVKLLPHIKMLFEIFNPSLEDCWLDGYNEAKNSSENNNPHQPGTTNHFYWEEGWWTGFYDSICDNDTNYNHDKNIFDSEKTYQYDKVYSAPRYFNKVIENSKNKKPA